MVSDIHGEEPYEGYSRGVHQFETIKRVFNKLSCGYKRFGNGRPIFRSVKECRNFTIVIFRS